MTAFSRWLRSAQDFTWRAVVGLLCLAGFLVCSWTGFYYYGYKMGQEATTPVPRDCRGVRHEIIAIRDCRGDTCYGITKDGQTVALRPNTMVGDKPLIEWPKP